MAFGRSLFEIRALASKERLETGRIRNLEAERSGSERRIQRQANQVGRETLARS